MRSRPPVGRSPVEIAVVSLIASLVTVASTIDPLNVSTDLGMNEKRSKSADRELGAFFLSTSDTKYPAYRVPCNKAFGTHYMGFDSSDDLSEHGCKTAQRFWCFTTTIDSCRRRAA